MEQITDDIVSRLAQPIKRMVIMDTDLGGFGVLALPSGVVSYFVNYSAEGRKRRVTVGHPPAMTVAAARATAAGIIAQPSLARPSRAGRKPKGWRPPSSLSQPALVVALGADPPDEIDIAAQNFARETLESAVSILLTGRNEAAKIAAAREILDRGYGKPAVEIGGDAPLFAGLGRAATVSEPSASEVFRAEARKFAVLALETLRHIATAGASETARAAAIRVLQARMFGGAAPARLPDEMRDRPLGKKETALRAAKAAASGRYATPSPPSQIGKDPE